VLVRILPGIVLTYFQVTVLTALSVAFSTRLPIHWNISLCIAIYLLGHLAPMMVLAGEPNLRDVIAFPKNQAGIDPMSGAPSEVTDDQLEELGIEVVAPEEERSAGRTESRPTRRASGSH